jgi:transporter family-2 protein
MAGKPIQLFSANTNREAVGGLVSFPEQFASAGIVCLKARRVTMEIVNLLLYVFAFAAGSASPVQAGASSQLNKGLASPIWSALFVYASGLAGVLLIQLVVRQTWPAARLGAGLPWWVWTGGVLSIASTLSGLTLAQKMGSGLFTGLSLTAALLTSIVLDQFGLMGFKPHPVTSLRAAGAALMIAGIWLIAKF